MKRIVLSGFAFIMLLGNFSCSAQDNKDQSIQKKVSSEVEVYYFHFTRRCNTCISVEENSKLAVETLYPEKVKTGEYTFTGINLDDASSKDLAEKLGIGGQTLLIVHGDKKIDITGQAFMYAHDLEKMKEVIKNAIEEILKS